MAPVAQTGGGNVTTATATSGSTIAPTLPSNAANGDLLMAAAVGRTGTLSFSGVPSGWTTLQTENTNGTLGMFAKPITNLAGEPSSYTWTFSSAPGRMVAAIWRVTGADQVNFKDAVGAASTTGTTSITAPAVTAVSTSALLIACFTAHRSNADSICGTATGMSQVLNADVTQGTGHSNMEIDQLTLTASGSTGTETSAISPVCDVAAAFMATIAPSAFDLQMITQFQGYF